MAQSHSGLTRLKPLKAESGLRFSAQSSLLSLVLIASLSLSGCQLSSVFADISASEGFKLNQEQVEALHNDYELIKQVSSQLSSSNIYDERLQPVNQRSKCLIPFMVANHDGVQQYWDGACKEGFASGLGRLVRLQDGKKTHEFLLDIVSPEKLISYLQYDLENMEVEVGYSELNLHGEQLKGHGATLGYNMMQWHNNLYNVTYRYEDTSNLMSYTKVVDLISGEISSIIAYPNYSHDVLNAQDNELSTIDRTYRLLDGSDMVGFGFIWLKNGQLVMRDAQLNQDSVVVSDSSEIDDFVASIEDKVDHYASLVEQEVDQGFKQVDLYRNTKCPTHHGLFRGDEVSAVCEFIDEFRANYESMQESREDHIKNIEAIKPQQEKSLQELEKHLQDLKISLLE